MGRKYVNDHHRANAEKLRKLEEELGLASKTEDVETNPDPNEVVPNPEDLNNPPVPDPGQEDHVEEPPQDEVAANPEESVETNPPPSKPKGEHDWEKRERDAKEAQRKLSIERTKLSETIRQIEEREKAQQEQAKRVEELLKQLDAKLATPAPEPPKPQFEMPKFELPEDLADIERDLPEVSKLSKAVVHKMLTPALEKLEALEKREAEREAALRKAEEEKALFIERQKAAELMEEIQKAHPDAFEVASSADFQAWLEEQPPAWKDIVVNTYKYTAKDAVRVLGEYKRETSPAPATPPPAPRGPEARPRIRSSASEVKTGSNSDVYTMEQLRNQSFMNSEMQRDLKGYRSKLDRTLKQSNLTTE